MATSSVSAGIQTLLQRTAAVAGSDFFLALSAGLSELLGTRYAFVGELTGSSRVRTLAFWKDGAPGEPFEYELAGSPCANVIDSGTCQYPCDAAVQFPRDALLAEMEIEAYFGVPVKLASGEVAGIIAALHDQPCERHDELDALLEVSAIRAAREIERDRLAAQLAESEERYRRIVTTCREGVWIIDPDERTTFVNEQMASMLGYRPEEMQGRSMYDFMDERARQEAQGNVSRRKRGIAESHEFRLRHRDGSDVWTLMSTTPWSRPDGTYAGAMALVSDVTERRGLELKVQHAQKLESLSMLAGGVAHDFNNLLVGILGNVGLAQRELPSESPVQPTLREIQDAALQAADLTKQLLAYSGRGQFVVEKLDCNTLIREMTHLLRTVISKDATLKLHLAKELPGIKADATQIRQIIMNLVTNASEALGGDGVISLATGAIEIDRDYLGTTYLDEGLSEGTYVFVEVADTGCGMDSDTAEKIFDPFFTTKFVGRGLGLAAVLGILRGHGGAIKVYSEPGKGSSFKVMLPAADASDVELAQPDRASELAGDAARATGLVLVVDDVDAICRAARAVLEEEGFEVITASNGEEAVEKFRERADEIACVLLDMTMPVMSGDEAFRELRRIRPGVRAVLSSGYNEQEATSRFVGKGLAGFLQKPWHPDDLIAAIRKAMAGS